MKCKDTKCTGIINTGKALDFPLGCHARTSAFPCLVCGKLHFANGEPATNHSGQETFLVDGKAVNLNPESKDLF
ncbi:MAG: hypothetical protein PHP35_02135 [Candidatus Colwellbacteria bacterium]|nr:hypothetical protein [Candidatus Colwellbacteria bacterium]